MLPVGLYFRLVCANEKKTTTAHPILTLMFKNTLRTFEAETLLQDIKKHSASAQKLDVLIKIDCSRQCHGVLGKICIYKCLCV